jgi:hypothetical protein
MDIDHTGFPLSRERGEGEREEESQTDAPHSGGRHDQGGDEKIQTAALFGMEGGGNKASGRFEDLLSIFIISFCSRKRKIEGKYFISKEKGREKHHIQFRLRRTRPFHLERKKYSGNVRKEWIHANRYATRHALWQRQWPHSTRLHLGGGHLGTHRRGHHHFDTCIFLCH